MCSAYRTEIAGFMSEYGRPARRATRSLRLKTTNCAAGGLKDGLLAVRAVQTYVEGYSPLPVDDDVSVLSGNNLPLQNVPKLRSASAPPGLNLAVG